METLDEVLDPVIPMIVNEVSKNTRKIIVIIDIGSGVLLLLHRVVLINPHNDVITRVKVIFAFAHVVRTNAVGITD